MKREFALLRGLIRNWSKATANPRVARLLICRSKIQYEPVREVCGELLLCDGDIHHAVAALSERRPALPWLPKMIAWADKALEGKEVYNRRFAGKGGAK